MKIEKIDLNKLLLDPSNSRFAELYSGSNKEEDLIDYLLYIESAEKIAKNISKKNEYYSDEVLWTLRKGNKFLVKDGNRRCAAVKALQCPSKYGLSLPKKNIAKLPVLIYTDKDILDRRIQEKHTNSLFSEWSSIAKALKVYEMHKSGSSNDDMREIDSNPARLIKLASFYYASTKIAGDNFKALLRPGKNKDRGKTIIFERLFPYSKICGFKFKKKPSYEINIFDKKKFEEYIKAIVKYLEITPDKVTHKDVDEEKQKFLKRLDNYGFVLKNTKSKTKRNIISVKKYPVLKRKNIPPKLKSLIDECYKKLKDDLANAKLALSRVIFETTLKYVIEKTKYNGIKLEDYNCFKKTLYFKGGVRRPYPNFTELKKVFENLIINTSSKDAFKQFDLNKAHLIIHNYKVGASPRDAKTETENLIPLLEFMLEEEKELLNSLDKSKII